MIAKHILRLIPTVFLAATGASCSTGVDERMEEIVAEHHSFCLTKGFVPDTPAYTDCILNQHQAKQREQKRLRDAVKAEMPKKATDKSVTPAGPEPSF